MKVAVLSESPADEAAVRILVDGLLGIKTKPVAPPPLRSRGWPSILHILPAVLKHLYYQTDADAFVVVVDSDDSPVHEPSHDEPSASVKDCRLCRLHSRIGEVQSSLRLVPSRSSLHTAVGLAFPCIEAWYRCGLDVSVSEGAWMRELRETSGGREKRLRLKRDVYGSDRCSLELKKQRATEEARRLVQDLDQLKRLFPGGFGALAHDVQTWVATGGPADV